MNQARYAVRHDTLYSYSAPVVLSRQLLHVTPRECAWQNCEAHHITIDPAPNEWEERLDYFGNPEAHFALETPHAELLVRADSVVAVRSRAVDPETASSPAWEDARAALRSPNEAASLEACQFLYESPYVRGFPRLAEFSASLFPPGRPVLDAAVALMRYIHSEFEFDPAATTVTTPLNEVIEDRRGVCQDFAHLMIACLRAHGIAARYISGYLLTLPPPGKPRLVGADASHAWVSVFVPGLGWIDFDPTNDQLPDTQHVTVAWGRDFSDVSPLRGVILGGGEHEVDVQVTVEPLAESSQTPATD
ncbi:MAG: transglutaminase family protein [Rhodocyclaceae bacterium]